METIQAYVTLIKDILTVLATAIAGVVAVKGFQTWKNELHWKTEYELAQRLAKATYKVRDAIAGFRDPLPIGTEVQKVINAGLEDKKIYNSKLYARAVEEVYLKRWQAVQEDLRELDAVSLEVEAIWGEIALERLKPLKECTNLLFKYMQMHIQNLKKQEYSAQETTNGVLYDSTDSPSNGFSKKITEAVRKIEDFLKPYLKI